jgi:hypothetical protein
MFDDVVVAAIFTAVLSAIRSAAEESGSCNIHVEEE